MSLAPVQPLRGARFRWLAQAFTRVEWSVLALGGGAQVLCLIAMLQLWGGWLPLPASAMAKALLFGMIPAALPLVFWLRLVRLGGVTGGIAPAAASRLQPLAPLLGSMVVVCYWWGHCMLAAVGMTAAHAALVLLAPAWGTQGQWLDGASLALGAILLLGAVPGLQLARRTAHTLAGLLAATAGTWLLVRGLCLSSALSAFQPSAAEQDGFARAGAACAALFMVGSSLSAYEGVLALPLQVARGRLPRQQRAWQLALACAATCLVSMAAVWLCMGEHPPMVSSPAGWTTQVDHLAPQVLLLGAGILALMYSQGAATAALGGVPGRRPGSTAEAAMAPAAIAGPAGKAIRTVPVSRPGPYAAPATVLVVGAFMALQSFPWLYAGAGLAYFVGMAGAAAVALVPPMGHHSARWRALVANRLRDLPGRLALKASGFWLGTAILGLQAWGMQAVLIGLVMIYGGGLLHIGRRVLAPAYRPPGAPASIHAKLLAGMLLTLALNGMGYLIAHQALSGEDKALAALVGDVFTAVALLTVLVGLVLPALIVHALTRAADAAESLAQGTVAQLRRAIDALGRGELDHQRLEPQLTLLETPFRDEIGRIATSINLLQADVRHAAVSLEAARDSLRRSRADLFRQARHDSLTGLHNRRAFEEELARVASDRRHPGQGHALLYLDLDQFKIVNDTCGHNAGDELLRQISLLLSGQTRSADILSRLGGDEFGVILENCSREDAVRIAEAMLTAVRALSFGWHDRVFRVGVSIGVVHFISGTMTITDVMSAADKACYYAKEQGRNRLHAYSPDDDEIRMRSGEMQWVSRIHEAMEQGRLCLYAQRIVALRPGNVQGQHFEVLLRMVDVAGELVPPMAFIPAAERFGVMPMIDRWVVRTALERLAGLLHESHGGTPISLAINLSGASITDESFLEYIKEQFRLWQVPHQAVWFEITETSAIANLKKAKRFIAELRGLGCRFGLDDFGAGMSSFGYLRQLDVDFLKIDGLFVQDMVDDPIDRAMVESINRIGQLMGLETIAEFVESGACTAMLDRMGVNMVQGNGVAEPVPFVMQAKVIAFPPEKVRTALTMVTTATPTPTPAPTAAAAAG